MTGKPSIETHTHFDKDSNERYVEVTAYPVKEVNDEIIEFVHISGISPSASGWGER